MPTGYTAKLCEGEQPFNAFVWDCARAFGALVMMRDDPIGTPIPENLGESTYYEKRVVETDTALKEWLGSSEESRRAMYASACATATKERDDYRRKKTELRARLNAMLDEVRAWEPPSTEHHELKEFMAQQITSTIDFDCGDYEPSVPAAFDEWCASYEAELVRSVAYATKSLDEERARNAERRAWIHRLRESVPPPEGVFK